MLRRGRGRGRRRAPVRKIAKVQIKAMQGRDYHTAACMRALISPSRGPTPFPDRMRCVLTFSNSYLILLGGTAAAGRQQYAMNSLYDPDFTGSGAQPEYFDQLAALYNRYRVYGSAIKVTCIPFSAATQVNVPVNVVLVPTAQSLASYGIEEAMGLPRAQNRVSTGNMDYKNQTLIASHSVSEILGVKDVEGADRLQAQVSSSPAEECLWAIVARTADSTTTATLAISVRITYDCEFFDRAVATQSLLSKNEKKHLDEIKKELKEIDAYQKLHKTFEPADYKDSVRGPLILDNTTVHEKWLKLREVDDQMPKETPKSRPPSKK